MAICEDLSLRSRAPAERIIAWRRPVVTNPQRFAGVVVQTLGLHAEAVILAAVAAEPVAVANGYVEHRVWAEVDPAREGASGLPCVGDENFFDVFHGVAV